jgi:hypothetical protein
MDEKNRSTRSGAPKVCCCVGEYKARIMACSVIFHAITIGVPPKRGVSNQRVGEIRGLEGSSILDELLSQGLIYCGPSRKLNLWRPTHVGGGLEYRLLSISGFSARAENKSPLHAWGVKRYGPTGDSQSGCL